MSDIDTAPADSLKVLDPERPIREADMLCPARIGSFGPEATIGGGRAVGAYDLGRANGTQCPLRKPMQ